MNESCHTNEWVVTHIWMSRVTHMNESCHTYEWLTSPVCMNHVTHMIQSCRAYECVMQHIQMSHTTHRNELCHTYAWVMTHTWTSHVTHMHAAHSFIRIIHLIHTTHGATLKIFGSRDLTILSFDLFGDGDSVYARENLYENLGTPVKTCLICKGIHVKTCWKFW